MMPLDAVRELLADDAELWALTEGRIWARGTPPAEAHHMPRKAVMLRSAGTGFGGLGNRSYIPIISLRVDLWGFGETPFEGARVFQAAYGVMTRNRSVLAGGLIVYPAIVEGGPLDVETPDTQWPATIGTYVVQVSVPETVMEDAS